GAIVKIRHLWCVGLLLLTVAGCSKSKGPSREELVKQADDLFQKQQFNKAANVYAAAARKGEPDGQILMKASRANLRADKFRLAPEAAFAAANAMPNDFGVQLYAARLLRTQRRFDDVAERMSSVVRKD